MAHLGLISEFQSLCRILGISKRHRGIPQCHHRLQYVSHSADTNTRLALWVIFEFSLPKQLSRLKVRWFGSRNGDLTLDTQNPLTFFGILDLPNIGAAIHDALLKLRLFGKTA